MGQITMVKRMRSIRACNFDDAHYAKQDHGKIASEHIIVYPVCSSFEIRMKSIILIREHIQ